MSVTTAATPYTMTTLSTCAAHPGKYCVEFTLSDTPEGDELRFTIVPMRYTEEPTQIAVVQDLLVNCKPYRAPFGNDVMNNRTVHFFWPKDTHDDIVYEAKTKLQQKFGSRIDEIMTHINKVMAERNEQFARDAQTNVVSPRSDKSQPASQHGNVW